MANGNFRYFMQNIAVKHRVSLRNKEDNEVWYAIISPLKFIGILFLWIAIVFLVTVIISAYTRLLNVVPGYDGITSRDRLIENIIKLDSLQTEAEYMQLYIENVAQMMEGKASLVHSLVPQNKNQISTSKEVVFPSRVDSLLRTQIETEDRFKLSKSTEIDMVKRIKSLELLSPVQGEISFGFNPSEKIFGVILSVSDIQQVIAMQNGTVILSIWEPEGYIVQIQHSSNLISTYKRLGQSHKSVGDRVMAGEAIGVAWNEEISAGNPTELEIQLWYDGVAIDPQQYITF